MLVSATNPNPLIQLQLIVFFFSGGLSNLLYHISLPAHLYDSYDDTKKHHNEPKEVLIRIYGQTHGEGALEALITESVIFTLLSERGRFIIILHQIRVYTYQHASRPMFLRVTAKEVVMLIKKYVRCLIGEIFT